MRSSELEIWTNNPSTTIQEKRKSARESSRKTKGSIPKKSLPVFLTIPSNKSPVFGKNNPLLRPLQFFPITK